MKRWPVHLAVLVIALSGCITQPLTSYEEEHLEPSDFDDTPLVLSTTVSKEAETSGIKTPAGDDEVAATWDIEVPTTVISMSFNLSWSSATHTYRVTVTDSAGTTQNFPNEDDDQHIGSNVTEALAGGLTTFTVYKRSGIGPDELHLDVDYSWFDSADAEPTIIIEQVGNKWQATRTLRAERAMGSTMQVDIDSFNGDITLDGSERDKALAGVKIWARGNSEAEARANLLLLDLQFHMSDAKTLIAITRDATFPRGEAAGADVALFLPGTVTGGVDSSNGELTFDNVALDEFVADSSNGLIALSGVSATDSRFGSSNGGATIKNTQFTDSKIDTSNGRVSLSGVAAAGNTEIHSSNGNLDGDIRAKGDLDLHTSNGGIDVKLTPMGNLDLLIDTSNGAIDLALKDANDIHYALDADTSNGQISEDMSTADYSGSKTRGTLESNGSGATKVTGDVETSNASIRFDGF